jgi:hypothetical protein
MCTTARITSGPIKAPCRVLKATTVLLDRKAQKASRVLKVRKAYRVYKARKV